jgi:RNA polymerase sigma-54 factor
MKRKSTILKVVEQIVKLQIDFFKHGAKALKPLGLKDVAEVIEMHESTVSRVTNGKYIDTPWGLVELKYFFSSGLRTESGEMKSSTSIKNMIKQIIDENAGNTKLSDQKIADLLENRGIKIVRRTVAKYRKALKILPSYHRR